jgi:hypothetical protein
LLTVKGYLPGGNSRVRLELGSMKYWVALMKKPTRIPVQFVTFNIAVVAGG